MNKNSNAIDRIFAAFTNYSGVRNLRRWLMALTLCALCASHIPHIESVNKPEFPPQRKAASGLGEIG